MYCWAHTRACLPLGQPTSLGRTTSPLLPAVRCLQLPWARPLVQEHIILRHKHRVGGPFYDEMEVGSPHAVLRLQMSGMCSFVLLLCIRVLAPKLAQGTAIHVWHSVHRDVSLHLSSQTRCPHVFLYLSWFIYMYTIELCSLERV